MALGTRQRTRQSYHLRCREGWGEGVALLALLLLSPAAGVVQGHVHEHQSGDALLTASGPDGRDDRDSEVSAGTPLAGAPDLFTVVVITFRRDEVLARNLGRWLGCKRAAKVFVIWNDVGRPIPARLLQLGKSPLVLNASNPSATRRAAAEARLSDAEVDLVWCIDRENRLSNRFRPRAFSTAAVFSVDDDTAYRCSSQSEPSQIYDRDVEHQRTITPSFDRDPPPPA